MSYGEPTDVAGQCNARLYIGDNFGDNHATMRCQLAPGHLGPHVETYQDGDVRVEWKRDEGPIEEIDEKVEKP
jgi:hypothetical protein